MPTSMFYLYIIAKLPRMDIKLNNWILMSIDVLEVYGY